MSDTKPIVVIGSINMDLVCRTSRRPSPGETTLGQSFATIPGGKGANQAVAAARLGGNVHMVGRVGDDAFGRQLMDGLTANGVGTAFVSVSAGASSGVAMIVVDDSGENSIIVVPGANGLLSPADVDAAEPMIAGAACVLLQLETRFETIAHAIDVCRKHGVYTILDPAPAAADLPAAFHRVDLFTPNEAEARLILGVSASATDEEVGHALLAKGSAAVVLKLGPKGAMICESGSAGVHVPAFAVNVVDTTAAGDASTAGLAVGLSEALDLPTAARLANAAGALACTTFGAQPSLPTRAAVDCLVPSPSGRGSRTPL